MMQSKEGAGCITGVVDPIMDSGCLAPWGPAFWRSCRLRRNVSSTLVGESHTVLDSMGHAEWLARHRCELRGTALGQRHRFNHLQALGITSVLDCKSVYDQLTGLGRPISIDDTRCAVDMVLARQSIRRLGATIRWAPTDRQLADAQTKDA